MRVIDILNECVKPSMGCTEPAAVALVAATARNAVGGDPQRVEVTVDGKVLRNGLAVGLPIPGQYRGNLVAAAVGAVGGNSDMGLEVLSAITAGHVRAARVLLDAGRITLSLDREQSNLYIEAKVVTSKGTGRATTEGAHTNITRVEVDGKAVKVTSRTRETKGTLLEGEPSQWLRSSSLGQIIGCIEGMDGACSELVLSGIRMNEMAADEGLRRAPGLAIGARLARGAKRAEAATDTHRRAQMMAAAAIDARMAGLRVQVMTSSGSGNQGIMVTMAPLAVARCLDLGEKRLAQSVALGHLLLARMTGEIGLLTALCGCAVQAAAAASAAIAWLAGGSAVQVEQAASLVLGRQAGVLCDGAKASCAAKAAIAAGAAVRSAELSLEGLDVSCGGGLIRKTLLETARDVGWVAREGMGGANQCILDILEREAA